VAFSDDAIGFYLEIDDSTFGPTLEKAQRTYRAYVKALDELNTQAFEGASSALGKVESLVKAVAELPERTLSGLKRSSATIAKAIKPFTVKANLEFSVSSRKQLSKAIGDAVTKALTDARVKLNEGRRMKALPDLVGRFDIPRLEEGGIVKGPNKAMDSVLALLKPGELVVPADVTQGLMDVAGQLRDASGKFVGSGPIAETLADVANLVTALKKVQDLSKAGLVNEREIKQYDEMIGTLNGKVESLDRLMGNLGYTTRVRLAPSIAQAKAGLSEFREEVEDTGKESDTLLRRILGPARFLALHKAITDVSNLWPQMKADAKGVFDEIAGRPIDSAVDNLNRMNTFLGGSREQLLAVKIAAFEAGEELGNAASVDQLTASMADLAEQGVRDTMTLVELGKTSALAAEGLGVAASETNKLGFEMTQSIGLQNQQFTSMIANLGRLSDANSGFNISAQELLTQTTADVEQMGASLRQLSAEDAQRTVNSFNQIGAVLQTQFIDGAGEVRQVLARAFEGGPENIEATQKAFLLTGLAQDELRQKLTDGDLAGIFNSIAENSRGMSPDQLRAFSEQVGVSSGDLQKFADGQDAINANLTRSNTLLVSNGEAMDVLAERATNNKTAFQQWATGVTNQVSNFDVFGVKMGEVLDLTKEFNVATLLSVGYLGKLAVQSAVAGGKLVAGLAGGLMRVTGLMGPKGIGGAVGKLQGGVGAGGMVSSVFTGLSTGMATLAGGVVTLGTALLSPPGIALTVSFVAFLLALGGALRLAAPAIKEAVPILVAGIGGVVDVGKALIEMTGDVLIAGIQGVVTMFQSLSEVPPSNLIALGAGLVSVAGGITAIAGSMAVLGAVQIGSAILAFFTGGAAGPGGTGSFLQSLLGSIAGLQTGPDQVKSLTATVNGLSGFVLAYARMIATIRDLPGEGLFGGLFGDDPAEKLAQNVGPFMDALEQVMLRVSQVQGFAQVPRAEPVPPQAIEQAIQAEIGREPREEITDKLDLMAGLLAEMLALMQKDRTGAARPEPGPTIVRGSRKGSPFTRDVAEGNY